MNATIKGNPVPPECPRCNTLMKLFGVIGGTFLWSCPKCPMTEKTETSKDD